MQVVHHRPAASQELLEGKRETFTKHKMQKISSQQTDAPDINPPGF